MQWHTRMKDDVVVNARPFPGVNGVSDHPATVDHLIVKGFRQ